MYPWDGKNIYFMGFMGTGKSRVGRDFASLLGWPFHDTDDLIEQQAAKSISDIFADDGEEAFRQIETDVIRNVASLKNNIIALGGGAIVRDENWESITRSGITVLLKASVDTIFERISRHSHRPLVAELSPEELRQKIQDMLQERNPYYERAQFIFDSTNDRSPREFSGFIFEKLLEEV